MMAFPLPVKPGAGFSENMDAGEALNQFLLRKAQKDPVLWSKRFRALKGHKFNYDILNELGDEPMRASLKLLLRHRPFLTQPLQDQHPYKVYKKARQVGVSELSITESLWFLWAHDNTKICYCFPRDRQLTDFSTTRIAEVFAETPYMRAIVGIPNQIYLKHISNSFLLLRSAWESNLGEGIDIDMVVFDEKDRMKEGIDVAFRESLSSSKYGWTREVSTPTLPGRGVDAPYALSTQFEWHVKCVKCGMRQIVDYPDNVVQMVDIPMGVTELAPGSYEFRCRKQACRGELDRTQGEWVAAYPNRKDIHGYWIPQTIAPWIDATDMMKKKIQYKFKSLFENYVLGRTSIGDNVLLTENDFENAIAGYAMFGNRTEEWSDISVGIDWGNLSWAVIIGRNVHNNRRYLLNMGVFEDDPRSELESVKAIDAFIAPFAPTIIVADAGYGKDRNSYLLKRYQNLFACFYNPADKTSRTFQGTWSEEGHRVLVDRTMTLKNVCRAIKEGELGFPTLDSKMHLIMRHFLNLAPMRIEEEGEIYETVDKTGDDHLAHAVNYSMLGLDHLEGDKSTFSFDFIG